MSQTRRIGEIQGERDSDFKKKRAEQEEKEELRSRHTYGRPMAVGLKCRDWGWNQREKRAGKEMIKYLSLDTCS